MNEQRDDQQFLPFNLRTFEEIPEKYRCIFSSYPCLNRIQSAMVDDIMKSDRSIVVTAPTGSGKTVLFELAIVKMLMNQRYSDGLVRAVYVAPIKALCAERFLDWSERFGRIGVSTIEVTGDSVEHLDILDHQIILTTPEKWDSLTRRWRDNLGLVQVIKLFLLDEVHLISEKRRGPVLESIVCRMKTVSATARPPLNIRFIAASATIANIDDLASWLNAKSFKFNNDLRPVALKRIVKGYFSRQSYFQFDIALSYKLKQILMDYSERKPVLIFCSTRRSVVQTSKVLSEQITFNFSTDERNTLLNASFQINDAKLGEYVRCGIGFHHAGLSANDRNIIQLLFSSGHLPILVATSTLSMGVNLPAHMVIIKSTEQYVAGRVQEYPQCNLLQMVGRAGRPQFDTSAVAVIMTRENNVKRYEDMLDCNEILESSLLEFLPECLNSEIVLNTITDLSVAMEWMRCTFLYQRASKNPRHYGLTSDISVERGLENICLRELNALKRENLVTYHENGLDISPTPYGRLMSHFYLHFDTFKLFRNVPDAATLKDLLMTLCEAKELEEMQLRQNERRLLNELNVNKIKETIRFPLLGKVASRSAKANCLVQACLGCLPIGDAGLQQEAVTIIQTLHRAAKCLAEFQIARRVYCAAISSALLRQCLSAKLWENSPYVAKQLDRIGSALAASLSACGKTSFQSLEDSNPRELENILNRVPPAGNLLQNQISHLPKYEIHLELKQAPILSLDVSVEILNWDLVQQKNTAGLNHAVSFFIGDSNNKLLSYHRLTDLRIVRNNFSETVHFQSLSDAPRFVYVNVISESWVGLDVRKQILINQYADSLISFDCFLSSEPEVKKKGNDACLQQPKSQYWKNTLKCQQQNVSQKKAQVENISSNFDIFDEKQFDFEIDAERSTVSDFYDDYKKSYFQNMPFSPALDGIQEIPANSKSIAMFNDTFYDDKTDFPLSATVDKTPSSPVLLRNKTIRCNFEIDAEIVSFKKQRTNQNPPLISDKVSANLSKLEQRLINLNKTPMKKEKAFKHPWPVVEHQKKNIKWPSCAVIKPFKPENLPNATRGEDPLVKFSKNYSEKKMENRLEFPILPLNEVSSPSVQGDHHSGKLSRLSTTQMKPIKNLNFLINTPFSFNL